MFETTDAVVVIPARAGSKCIPAKNIKQIAGKPLLQWSIEACRAVESVGGVFVSTDSQEIGELAETSGAIHIHRPESLAGDYASSESAILHALKVIEDRYGRLPAVTLFVQCTSPLIIADDVSGVLSLVFEQGYDSAVTATRFHHFIWRLDGKGQVHSVNHSGLKRAMRQELPTEFLEVGAVYGFRTEGFRSAGFRFFGKIGFHEIPLERSFEIDTPNDWIFVEKLLRSRIEEFSC